MHSQQERQWIERSGLFSAEWYLEKYPDVKRSGLDPLFHWCEFGHKEGRDPNSTFSVKKYRSIYVDCFVNMNPLVHAEKARVHNGIADHRIRVQQLNGNQLPSVTAGGTRVIPSEIIDVDAIRNVAVIKLDHIGDAYLSIPVLMDLKMKFSCAEFTIFCAPYTEAIFNHAGFVNTVTVDVFPAGGVGHAGANNDVTIPKSSYDLAIDLRVDRDARDVVFAVGATLTAAFDPIADFHLPYLGVDVPHERQLKLLVERIPVAAVPYAKGNLSKELNVALCPSSSARAKQWPRNQWVELAKLLKQEGHKPIFIGAPTDGEKIKSMTDESGAMLHPAVDMPLYGEWIRENTDVYIGCDTGPTHSVAISGHPVIEIIGGFTNVEEWISPGANVIGLHHPTICQPCFSPHECPYDWKCLAVKADEVVWAINRLMAN